MPNGEKDPVETLWDRVDDLEADLHGPKETRRREYSPGLFAEVKALREDIRQMSEALQALRESRGEAQAITQTKQAMIKLMTGVIIAQIGIFTLLLRVADVI